MSAPIEIIAIRRLDGSSAVRAFVDLRIGGVTIRGAKIVRQPGQRAWLAMPSVKTERGNWLTTVELSPSLRPRVSEVAVAAWQATEPAEAAEA